ncbi:hypothetical protein PhCBS80983_g02150 [Powellomyces hirtus]|uniref:Oxidoreductase-like domain-containing protein n=1 Tax=Powellomyces hirtus TaxID=109895 RepID=A0A507E759_9FUNG|nr:hypothetical protein PhCBS80983_g02150 [Powellomyces hirtus]
MLTRRNPGTVFARITHLLEQKLVPSAVGLRQYGSRTYRGYWALILEQPHSEQFDPTRLRHVFPQDPPPGAAAAEVPEAFIRRPTSDPPDAASATTTPSFTEENNVTVNTVEASAEEDLARLLARENLLIAPEVPTNCCMSGCMNCVWDLYADEMETYQASKRDIRQCRRDLLLASGREQEIAQEEEKEVPDSDVMDPGMAAFLEFEKKMQSPP